MDVEVKPYFHKSRAHSNTPLQPYSPPTPPWTISRSDPNAATFRAFLTRSNLPPAVMNPLNMFKKRWKRNNQKRGTNATVESAAAPRGPGRKSIVDDSGLSTDEEDDEDDDWKADLGMLVQNNVGNFRQEDSRSSLSGVVNRRRSSTAGGARRSSLSAGADGAAIVGDSGGGFVFSVSGGPLRGPSEAALFVRRGQDARPKQAHAGRARRLAAYDQHHGSSAEVRAGATGRELLAESAKSA